MSSVLESVSFHRKWARGPRALNPWYTVNLTCPLAPKLKCLLPTIVVIFRYLTLSTGPRWSLLFFLSCSMSLLNHSCDPNCSIVFNGPHLLLRAVRDIEAGEEVRNPCFPLAGLLFHQRPSQQGPALKPVVSEGQLFIVLLPRRRCITPLPSDSFIHHLSQIIDELACFL